MVRTYTTNTLKDRLTEEPKYNRRRISVDKGSGMTRTVSFATENTTKFTPEPVKRDGTDSAIDRLANQLAETSIQLRTQNNPIQKLIRQFVEILKVQQQNLSYVDRNQYILPGVNMIEVNTMNHGRYGYGGGSSYGRRYRSGPDRSGSHMCYFFFSSGWTQY